MGERKIAASFEVEEALLANDRGLFLLAQAGHRPDRAAIREFARNQDLVSISFDPAAKPALRIVGSDGFDPEEHANNDNNPIWMELLCAGLTFDLQGLHPADPMAFPDVEHSFDFEGRPSKTSMEAMKLMPGKHLSGGEGSLPIMRAMLALGRDLVQHFPDLEAAIWAPSKSVIGRRFFESTVTAWLDGGAFPALGLTAFRDTFDGGLQSVGLDFMIGQEIWLEPNLAGDKASAARLGIRLVNQLVITGTIMGPERIVAPDGRQLVLVPSADNKIVRVQSE